VISKVETTPAGVTIAWLEGRLNVGSNLLFLEGDLKKIVEGGAKSVVLNLAGVNYVDSAGLGVLIGIAGMLRQAGGEAKIAALQPRVAEIFNIARLPKVVPVYADNDAALAAFASPSGTAD
jgi:anti-sigma B factor antagonist